VSDRNGGSGGGFWEVMVVTSDNLINPIVTNSIGLGMLFIKIQGHQSIDLYTGWIQYLKI